MEVDQATLEDGRKLMLLRLLVKDTGDQLPHIECTMSPMFDYPESKYFIERLFAYI